MSTGYELIDNETALMEICQQLQGSPWLAVDTEFEREKTFYAELCLLQVASADVVALIDPLAIDNLQVIFDLLYDPAITKVFHAARQDLEIFFKLQGAIPQPLFDTQLAAPLLGYDEQMGYANLVNKVLGVTLSKAHTRTDWKRRPLRAGQLHYAADDVIFLGRAYCALRSQLQQQDRLAWLEADFTALANPDLYQPEPETVWSKHRGAKKLKGEKLSVLQHLTAWRERRARAENRPRNWLLRDDVIVDLARLQPRDLAELGQLKGLSGRLRQRHGEEILKIIDAAKQQTPLSRAAPQQRKALDTQEAAKVDALTAIVRLAADANNMHPNVLASRNELEKFVRHTSDSPLLEGWREHLIGNQLRAFMHGGLAIRIVDDAVIMQQL